MASRTCAEGTGCTDADAAAGVTADLVLPLSAAQRRIWFVSRLGQAHSVAYHLAMGMQLHGDLDRPRLRAALDRLLQRHDVLRSRISETDGAPYLHIGTADAHAFALVEHDLRADRGALAALIEQEAQTPFDLCRGPLLRGRLIALAEHEHVLLLSVHHVVADATSQRLLARDLARLYALTQTVPPPCRFADCVRAQHAAAQDPLRQAQHEYWRRTLHGAPALWALPTDRPRPPQQDAAGGFHPWHLPAPLAARLRQRAQQRGTTLFAALLAGWNALAMRLTDQRDVVVGVAAAGRAADEQDTVGCFVTMLPVRVTGSESPTLAELLARTGESLQAAREHQELPFEQIVEQARVERSLGHHPVFQSLFTWLGREHGGFQFDALEVTPLDSTLRKYALDPADLTPQQSASLILHGGIGIAPAKLDLSLTFWQAGAEIAGGIDYAAALFEPATVVRLLDYWTRLLQALADDDAQSLDAVPLLAGAEREQVLYAWNATAVDPVPFCVHTLFEQQAARTPDAPALEHGALCLSYAQLDQRANTWARRLRELGLGAGHSVAVALERGVDLVVALLAVLKCGAAYVPLDPAQPARRLAYAVGDSAASIVLADDVRAEWTQLLDTAVRVLDACDLATAAPAARATAPVLATPHDLAYVIYTSGTTGLPKGVMIEHAGVVNLLQAMAQELRIAADDRMLALTTIGFDIAALELFLPLTTGACVVLAGRDAALDPYRLQALLDHARISIAQATPTTWRLLLDSGWPGRAGLRVLCGGEALPRELALRLRERVAAAWNVYGPTETTIWSSIHRIERGSGELAVESIGRPRANTRIYVRDRHGNALPPGVTGELCIGGAGVARGYRNRAELSAERFVADPFAPVPSARLYRSGDLARWRHDGTLEFLGRNDAQVKINGFRIELGEIEARLLESGLAREAAVVVREDTAGHARLVAYCVAAAATDGDALRDALAAYLPNYMVPERYVLLEALPVSANGKIDRLALPDALAPVTESAQRPLAGLESEIEAIWSALLGLPAIARDGHFFRLGGHSLLAVQVVARVRGQLGVEVEVAQLFAHPQLAAFAAQVALSEAAALPPLQRAARGNLLPLAPAQRRLWLVAQMGAAASRAYHMPLILRLSGAVDVAALQHALNDVLQRHEALRTVFPQDAGEPRQQVLAAAALPLRELTPAAADEAALAAALAAEIAAPFDLARELPLRAALSPPLDGARLLVVTQHHIASDGWSLALFAEELAAGYDRHCGQAVAAPPPLPVQYADYTVWLQRWLSPEKLQRQANFWKSRLAGAPALLALPYDRPRPAQQDHAGDVIECALAPPLVQALQALGERAGTTLFMTLLAAWAVLLGRLSGRSDIVIGAPLAGRTHAHLEALIGLFANTVALRLDLSGNPGVLALLQRVREEVLLAQQHGDVPFEQVVDALQPPRSAAHTPLFQVALAWQSVPPPALSLHGVQVTRLNPPAGELAKFDLSLYLWQDGAGVSGMLEYATALFDRSTVARWLEHWQVLLQALAADAQQSIAALPLLTATQRAQLLAWGRGPRRALPTWRVHRRVEAIAAALPQQPAVVQRDRRIGYAELETAAARLAAQLRARGLQRGDRVAVCLPRSIEFVVALLGVLKAGGAYLAVDPALPDERVAFMLADCGAAYLIGDGSAALAKALQRIDIAAAFAPGPVTAAPIGEHAEDLAYLVYTSGSTGQPKGIAIRHASLANFVQWCDGALGLAPGRRNSCVVGLAFDALAMEIWPTLCAGATLLLAPVEAALDADALLHWWAAEPLDCGLLPTSLAEVAFATGQLNPGLSTLVVGGARLTRLPPARAGLRLLNMYGPAEATVAASCAPLAADERSISIGRPLDNVQIYILDELHQPVPPGVAGELHIAGAGVAAGYLGRPELDAQRFLPDPFAADGSRMYASGDLARWLDDGRIDFVGRRDDQVKLRGLRIELGEVEACLAAHPAVREAVVSVGGEQLIAHVCAHEAVAAAAAAEQVAQWQAVHDEAYSRHDDDVLFEYGGWNSSYSGDPIPLPQMREWQEHTVARIQSLQPRRVLEIGCGSGLLLLRIAPQCERYVGIDLSAQALQRLARKVERLQLHQAALLQGSAGDLGAVAGETFDTVVINSVVQYFPDKDYLDSVLRQAAQRLQPHGRLFVGDVRNLQLAADFHRGVQAARGVPAAQLDEAVRRALAAEPELLVAPQYFVEFTRKAGLGALQVWPKCGADNELTRYRYDVVLQRQPLPPGEPALRIDGSGGRAALAEAVRRLHAGAARVVVAGIANAALVANRHLPSALTPTAVLEELQRSGGDVQLSWIDSDAGGSFHALLQRDAAGWAHETLLQAGHTPPPRLTSTPPLPDSQRALRRELRQWLAQRLPDYMVPAQLVFLRRLPLTANGKIDMAALPPPPAAARIHVVPRTPMERLLAAIWSEVLAQEPIGAEDHFFELGGHSLAAVQVAARLRRPHAIAVSLPQLFQHPVLADLARVLAPASTAGVPPVAAVPRDQPLAASFEQEGLWFLSRLPGGGAAYNMFLGLHLRGRLDEAALRRALDALCARHESLRTGFVERDGRLELRIAPAAAARFALRTLSLEQAERLDQALADLSDDENDRHFDLARGEVIRGCLARLREDEHALLISLHHIAGDGWSFGVLLRDLGRLYAWHCGGAPPPPPAVLGHADYAAWQRRWAERHFAEQSGYWSGALAGAPPLLELPADRVRPKQQDFAGGFVAVELGAALGAALRRACRQFGTTPFVLLLAAWAVLLSRLSGQDDVVIGTPSANREQAELEDVIGLFVNTLALRLSLAGAPRLSALLAQVEASSLAAQQHQNIPFEHVVELVHPARSLAYNPVFQAMFAWQPVALVMPELPQLVAARLADPPPRHAKFDLTLVLGEAADGIAGGIEYSTALFDASTMQRYAEHWLTLLAQMCSGEDRLVDELELLSAAQRRRVLHDWNNTQQPFPQQLCLHQLFEQAAAAAPQAIAVSLGARALSYAELDARATALAQRLHRRGLLPEERVAVCIPRSIEMIVAVLGVLKAGGAYVPVDLSHPAVRVAHVLNDSAPRWALLSGEDELEQHPHLACIDVARIGAAAGDDDRGGSDTAACARADGLAYVIYTSGSTGAPKGVMVEHRPVVNRLLWMQRRFAMGAQEVVLQKTPLSFDVSVWEIFMPLIGGGRLVLAEPDSQRDPLRLARLLRDSGVTTAHFVPSMLQVFLAGLDDFRFPSLRRVVCSGEELPPAVVEDFQRKLQDVEIYNFYGPTEAAIEVSWHRCGPDHGAVRVPIGKPIDNCRLYVLDRRGRLQPPGAAGELYIAGTPLARGYLNRDALTAERFLPDPFAADASARMYRTGDLARWTAAGEIDFLGRNDAQIKLRGFRIELSEIESQLARHPGIAEAAVALCADAAGGPALVAYWIGAGSDEAGLEPASLRAYLAAALPEYMLPANFVRLQRLPLNPNGKLDRDALPALAPAPEAGTAIDAVPSGEREEAIAAAWQAVLGRGGHGREDNFFAVGGHSLLTLRLARQLQHGGLPVEIADLFRYPTIAALAEALQRRDAATAEAALVRVRDGEGRPLFLLHDGFGLLLYAHVLAAQLPAGFAILGLADTAPAQDESASIALLADRLLPALRAQQPCGPYRLAGWSFGGLLAYELATRLVDAGERVEYLGLIDSYYRFEEPGSDEHPTHFAETPAHVAALDPAQRQASVARHQIYALAARRYAARPLHLPVDLIKTEQCDFMEMRAFRGWERVLPADALRVREVGGCHYSMMSAPFVAATAAAVAAGLAAAQAGAGG